MSLGGPYSLCAVSHDLAAHERREDRAADNEAAALAATDEWCAEYIAEAKRVAPGLWNLRGAFGDAAIEAVELAAYDTAWRRAKRVFNLEHMK